MQFTSRSVMLSPSRLRGRFLNRFTAFLLAVITLCLPLATGKCAEQSTSVKAPNIVLVFIDDMGWSDLGCYGSRLYETPNIDRLAKRGMRFTNAYAACTVCSPSRAALLTGKYPARLHLTDWIAGHRPKNPKMLIPDWTKRLVPNETTLAERLKSAGYATAHVGKWHLGDEACYPQHQGFDINIGGDHWGQPASYFWPYKSKPRGKRAARQTPMPPGGQKGEYLTDRLTDESMRWIREKKDGPFFIYLAHYAVHTPLQAKPELVEYYRKKIEKSGPIDGQGCAVYAAMVHSVDESLGRITDELARLKIADNTIVIFSSDNGGLILPFCKGRPVTANLGLRAGKGSAYEGGVRVPLIVDWPGVVRPGSTCDVPAIGVDVFPTVLDMAGVGNGGVLDGRQEIDGESVDGESLVPLLKQTGTLERDAIYWHYPHYHPGGAKPYSAVRQGDLCLIEFFGDKRIELYNLKEDLGQKTNLVERMPEKAKQLHRKLAAWRKSVGAQLPTPNPDYDLRKKTQGRPWLR